MKKVTGLKEDILLLAALSGELSDTAVRRLHPSYGYISNCLSGLREDNLLRKINEDKMTGYKLTVRGKHFVSLSYPEKFAGFIAGGVAGTAESLVVGVVGCLIFGIAMCMGLGAIGGTMTLAVIIGTVGIMVMLPAYPIYRKISRKTKEEYAPRIIQLADEIQNNQD